MLNRLYSPFYKWKMRGMEEFGRMTDLKDKLLKLMGLEPDLESVGADQAEVIIEAVCQGFVRELNRQGLSDSKEMFLEVQKEELMRRCR